MRTQQHSKYLMISMYCVGAALTVFVVIWACLNFGTIWGYLAICISTLWLLLRPLFVGLFIAYLLDPMVNLYMTKCQFNVHSRWYGYRRLIATLFTFLTVICFVGLFVLVVTMNVKRVIGTGTWFSFVDSIQYYSAYFQHTVNQLVETLEQFVPTQTIRVAFDYFYGMVAQSTSKISLSFFEILQELAAHMLSIGLGFVIAFYLLKDKEPLLSVWNNILKKVTTRKVGAELHAIAHDMDYVFSGYIRGQLIDAAIMGILTSLALTLVGLDFAIIIGIISGLFNIIPYFGPLVGVVLSGVIGLLGGEPTKAVIAMGAVFILQQLDGWFIVPKIMGESVKLHPIVVLLAIVIGGELWGFAGILLGVPIAAFIRCMIVRYVGDIFSVANAKKDE
ncbi:MAG: AI-2E family transporter [Cellulosilyticaceae bacterium]